MCTPTSLSKAASIAKTLRPKYVEQFKIPRVHDMTQREQYTSAQRVRTAQRLSTLGEMTGGIVHDFRNILAIIGSSLTLAERHSGDPKKLRASIDKAREGVRRGAKLTAQLLTFAKEHDLGAREGNLNECLKDLELLLKSGAGPEIRIVLQLASDIPKCLIDRSQFNAAILNLVVNAHDALPKGGTIEISTERWTVTTATVDAPLPGTYVRVQVKDNGHGMLPEVIRRVFDPFFTTKGEGGTGLGLPQVSAFMRLINGHISIASERGLGTTVSLFFPSAEADDDGATSR
jgi:signal transduction histidine kinase